MATKKRTKKKATTAKPFVQEEVISFPCGAKATIDSWGPGGVILRLNLNLSHQEIKFCISDEALKMLPMLSKRGLATVEMA